MYKYYKIVSVKSLRKNTNINKQTNNNRDFVKLLGIRTAATSKRIQPNSIL